MTFTPALANPAFSLFNILILCFLVLLLQSTSQISNEFAYSGLQPQLKFMNKIIELRFAKSMTKRTQSNDNK